MKQPSFLKAKNLFILTAFLPVLAFSQYVKNSNPITTPFLINTNIIETCADLGIISAGHLYHHQTAYVDTSYLVKLDAFGNHEWAFSYTFGNIDNCDGNKIVDILRAVGGGYYLLVENSMSATEHHFQIIRISNNGNLQWRRHYTFPTGQIMYSGGAGLKSYSNGDLLFVPNTFAQSGATKMDSLGNIIWDAQLIDTTSGIWGANTNIDAGPTFDNGAIILTYGVNSLGHPSPLLSKINSSGIVQWSKKITSPVGYLYPSNINQTSDGGYVVSGNWNDYINPECPFILKVDGSGNILWTKYYDISGGATHMFLLNNGNIVMGGMYFGPLVSYYSSFIINADSLGDIDGAAIFADSLELRDLHKLPNQDLAIAHWTDYKHIISRDDGNFTFNCDVISTNIQLKAISPPLNISTVSLPPGVHLTSGTAHNLLIQNRIWETNDRCSMTSATENVFDTDELNIFPNPSNGIFNMNSQHEITGIEVYNCLGEKIFTQNISGTNLTIDISNHSKGVYFIKALYLEPRAFSTNNTVIVN